MNAFIILTLMISIAFADTPPGCEGLAKIITSYETDLQKKTMNGCNLITVEQLQLNKIASDKDSFEERKCDDLMTIEAELENLKAQQIVLKGLDALKRNLSDDLTKTRSKEEKVQRVAGKNFATNLDIAQSIELVLYTETEDGTPLLEKLKAIPANKRINSADLKLRVTELCKGQEKKASDACNPDLFKPGSDAFSEINALLSKEKINEKEIKSWKNKLAIKKKNAKKDDEVYSFTQMKSDLSGAFEQIDKDAPLSKDQIIAIQKLSEFETANGFSFVEEIGSLKDISKSKIAFEKFSLHTGDTILRQELDTQSRVSVLWENIKKEAAPLIPKSVESCDKARNSHVSAQECIRALDNPDLALTDDTKSNLRRILPVLKRSSTFVEHLGSEVSRCASEFKASKILSESCANIVSDKDAELGNKIHNLNIIKERIGSENIRHMNMRNFALEKWNTQKCSVQLSEINFCEQNENDNLISTELLKTSGDVMKIAVMFTPKSDTQSLAEDICREDKLSTNETSLCKFMNDTTSNITPGKSFADDADIGTEAPDGGFEKDMVRDAWIQGGASVLQHALGGILNKQAPPFNPYQSNYTPYNYGPGTMGIADTIIFNSRYQGAHGFYMPTLGYTPYQAFGATQATGGTTSSNLTAYGNYGSANTASPSSYFNF